MTTRADQQKTPILGIRLIGIGPDGATGGTIDRTGGYLFCTPGVRAGDRRPEPPSAAAEDFEYWPVLDPSTVSLTGSHIDLFAVTAKYIGIDADLMDRRGVAPQFLHTAGRFDARLDADVDPGDDTITLTRTDLENTVVYVGDETIHLQAHQGDGTYDVSGTFSGRGLYGSREAYHPAGQYVYTTVPDYAGRACEFWVAFPGRRTTASPDAPLTYDWERRAVGTLAEGVGEDRASLRLKFSETLAAYQSAKRGRQDRSLTTEAYAQYGTIRDEQEPKLVVHEPIVVDGGSGVYKDGDVRTVEVDGRVYSVATAGTPGSTTDPLVIQPRAYVPLFDDIDDGEVPKEDGAEGAPTSVLRENRPVEVLCYTYPGPSPFYPGDASKSWYARHPLAWYAALHASSAGGSAGRYDVLDPAMSLQAVGMFGGSEASFFDDIDDLIEATPQRARIDQVVLGADNSSFDVRSWARRNLLRAFGFAEAPRESGEIRIVDVGQPDVDDLERARELELSALPGGTLKQSGGQTEAIDSVAVRVGDHPYATSPIETTIDATSAGVTRRQIVRSGDADATIHAETIAPKSLPDYERTIASRVVLQSLRVPRLTFTVRDSHTTGRGEADREYYDLGRPVSVADIPVDPDWAVDGDGERGSPDAGDLQWIGYLIGRRPHITQPSVDLDVLLLGDALVRLRGPSAILEGENLSGSTEISVVPGTFSDGTDAQAFRAGDVVQIRDYTGAPVDGRPYQVDGVSDGTISLSGQLAADYTAGHHVALAGWEAGGGAASEYDYSDRVYVYLADDDDTLASSDEPADIYGV